MALQPIFVKPLELGAVTAGNERAGYEAANIGRHKAAGLVWQSNGAASLYARGDFGVVRDVDFCAVLSANALSSTTFRLRLGDSQAEVDGTADYDSGAQTFISPSIMRDDGLYHSFWELPAVQTKRWWRLDIGGHAGDFAASMLVLGRKVGLAKFYERDFEMGVEDMGGAEITRHGVWDDQPGALLRTLSMTLNWMTEAEWEGAMRPLIEAIGATQPVYLCFDPASSIYRQARTYFGRLKKAPFASGKRKPGTYGIDLELISLF
jgi:hypothetical protein